MSQNLLAQRIAVRIVYLLLIVSAISVVGLWTLSTSTVAGESLFAVYLSMDLVAFAIMAHVYGTVKAGNTLRRIPLIAGCVTLMLLIIVGLSL